MLEFIVAVAVSVIGLFIVYSTFTSLSAGRVARIPNESKKSGKRQGKAAASPSGGKAVASPTTSGDDEANAQHPDAHHKLSKKAQRAHQAQKAKEDLELERLVEKEGKGNAGLSTDKPKATPVGLAASGSTLRTPQFSPTYAAVAHEGAEKPTPQLPPQVSERQRLLDQQKGFTLVAPHKHQSKADRAAAAAAASPKETIDTKIDSFFKHADHKGKRGGAGGSGSVNRRNNYEGGNEAEAAGAAAGGYVAEGTWKNSKKWGAKPAGEAVEAGEWASAE